MEPEESLRFLERLCTVDSRTVEGARGVIQVAEMLGARLNALGFDLEWFDPDPSEGPRGRHLKAVRNPGAARRIVFIGHTDTILSPADAPIRVDRQAQRMYGAGCCDMKGGCVILLEAIGAALSDEAIVRDAGLIVLLNCTEELAGPSFTPLARRTAQGAAACLGFEPAGAPAEGAQAVVVARKGVVRFDLACRGRAAHAGNDHKHGVNAVRELARKIEQVESLTDYAAEVTVNVGRISGGRASNQVADEAAATFEARAFDAALLQRTREAVRRICGESSVHSAEDGTPTRLSLRENLSYPPWPPNAATDALAARYARHASRRGVNIKPVRRGGASDASTVADLAPTLDGLGILGGGMHSPSEWADLGSFPLRVRIAADLVADLCAASA